MVPAKNDDHDIAPSVGPDLFHDPLGLIYSEHYRCRVICNTLDAIADKWPSAPTTEEIESLLLFLETDLPAHVADEEDALFPILKKRCQPSDNCDSVVNLLLDEHRSDMALVGTVVRGLKDVSEGRTPANPDAFLASVRAMTESQRRHLAWENSVLLPLAKKRLKAVDLVDLGRSMAERRGIPFDVEA